jgi:hypothetical protein
MTAIGANFSEVLERANRARLVFERARDILALHIHGHRCTENAESIEALLQRDR